MNACMVGYGMMGPWHSEALKATDAVLHTLVGRREAAGGGGIGRATAERFAEEGAKVVIAEINSETGAAAAEAARAKAASGCHLWHRPLLGSRHCRAA